MKKIASKTGLVRTKYSKPGINRYLISRRRLQQKLKHSLTCKLTLVMAPAGYGKTTAVLDWLEKCGLPAAWVSLDLQDNNPVTFWQYVCVALNTITKDISKETEYVFSSQELLKSNIHINILIDRLLSVQSDFLLVLDDLHLITDSSILEGLSYLIDYMPAKMHLIIISRRASELGLVRNRIKWQTLRLGESDLRFGEDEIFRFYQARGHTLDNGEVKRIEAYTEGWAAAMVAVAMSMEDVFSREDNTIAALTLSNRNIEQYLKDEVIDTWRPEKQSFAMKTSILDTLSVDLCNAVTGDCNGHWMLAEINETSGFLTVLDERKEEFRYHHLFKNFLYKLLKKMAPAEIPGLHAKAAGWFRERGLIPEAIEHYLNGGLYKEAFDLIEQQTGYMIKKNNYGKLLSWIQRLPEVLTQQSFKIAVFYAFYYAETSQYELSRQWVDRMKTMQTDPKYTDVPGWSSYSRTSCALAEVNLLVREGKIDVLPFFASAAETDDRRYFKILEYNDFNAADIYFYRCPFSSMMKYFGQDSNQYRTLVDSYRRLISKNPGYAPLVPGEYLYECNSLDKALPYLIKAADEASNAGCPGALVPAMVGIARIKRALGDLHGAFEALEECEKKLRCIGKSHWVYLLKAFRCRLFLDMGDRGGSEEWFTAQKLNIHMEINRIREFELIVYARVLMAKGRMHDAKILLQRLLSFTEDSSRLHSRVEVLNLLALLDFEKGDMPGALSYLESSLMIGIKEDYVRSFLDEFSPMANLLRYYIKRRKRTDENAFSELRAYARGLLAQTQENLFVSTTASIEASAAGMKKLLTAQEKKVLELLVNANTNKEISEKLSISLTTVKTHTGNIYSKLGVKNRSQCMRMIQEVGLLE